VINISLVDGIQVPKEIMNAIDLDKNNENSLWQDAIRTEPKQLTDYLSYAQNKELIK
jgi:hypothetical protein